MIDEGFEVVEASVASGELHEAFGRLVPQLSRAAVAPNLAALGELVESPCSVVLVARDRGAGQIVGSLTLVLFRIPTGVRGWIEDVVVDSDARGRGIGEALSRAALKVARDRGAQTVDLTSRPEREAANKFYRRIGFVRRDTNVYRFDLRG